MTEAVQFLYVMVRGQKAKMDERGASAVEYALLIAGIAALIVAVVFLFGNFVKGVFTKTCDSIAGGNSALGSC